MNKFENVRTRVFDVTIDIIHLCNALPRTESNLFITRQIIRSCTSIGANLEEAVGAYSKNDFSHCLNIAKKETRETHYWLRLLAITNSMGNFQKLLNETEELIKILTVSVKKSQNSSSEFKVNNSKLGKGVITHAK